MANWVFVNDGFIEEEKALLHFRDLSFQRGYGIFDFFRLVDDRPFFLEDHLDRFHCSAEKMHLPIPLNREDLKSIIFQLIEKNQLSNNGIRMGLTGGYSNDGFTLGKPNLVLSSHSFSSPTDAERVNGIQLLTYPYQRQLSQIKTIDYLMAIWLQPLKTQKGAGDILYHSKGFITECPRSNFFLVTQNGRIATPKENILKGITRKKIIELAKSDFIVEERPVHLDEIITAKEAFITSTTKQVLPVSNIDGTIFTDRKISSALLKQFRAKYGC